MKLKLINDINESRMYRSKQNVKRVTARQVADHTFLDMIAIWIMYNEFDFAPNAIDYARNTVAFNRFDNWRQSGTDLYLNLHMISQKRVDLLDSEADSVLFDRIDLDVRNIVRYLRELSRNTIGEQHARITFQRLERNLRIENSNYRSVRRLAQNWTHLPVAQKRVVVTRLMQFYRRQAPQSELYQMLKAFSRAYGLYDPNANNPERSSALKKAAAASASGAAGFAAGWAIGKSVI